MRRREFIALLGAAVARPRAAHAKNAAGIARIGYLTLLAPSSADDAFLEGLHDLGWIEGQNISIERRNCAGDVERLKKSAAELVQRRVSVLVTPGGIKRRGRPRRRPRRSLSFSKQTGRNITGGVDL